MFQRLPHRAVHYLLLLLTSAVLFFPNLGTPSLWDIDEGNNATCAWEMLVSGNWIVPTFNGELRVDKPALLYWLQVAAYQTFGVNEFAARLPSALAALLAVLLTYELGRRLFDAATGLLAGIVLASSVMFCAAAHFANPDALLNACTVLTFLFFWRGFQRNQNSWLIGAGASAGLAMLAKGPVGLALPGLVIFLFLLWTGRLRLLFNRYFGWGVVAFFLVAGGWYIRVGLDTKGEFLRGFLFKHNLGRFQDTMENHRGPIYYYLLVLMVGLAPWSIFLGLAAWYAGWSAVARPWHRLRSWWVGAAESHDGVESVAASNALPAVVLESIHVYRFLLCWIGLYLLFFSFSSTKLPNYILPVYAPSALLTARFLERWRRGLIQPPAWCIAGGLVCLGLVGMATTGSFLLASGTIEVSWLRERTFPELEKWAVLGLAPVLGALFGWRCWNTGRLHRLPAILATVSVLFSAGLFGGVAGMLEDRKAAKYLALSCQLHQPTSDIRVACHRYFRPSLVFYVGREIRRYDEEAAALAFLDSPLSVYLVLPKTDWERLESRVSHRHRVLGGGHDLYQNTEIVVVANQ